MGIKVGWFAINARRDEAEAGLRATANAAPRDAFPESFGVGEGGEDPPHVRFRSVQTQMVTSAA